MSADQSTWKARRKDDLRLADERLALHPQGNRLVEEIAAWLDQLRTDMPASSDRTMLLHRPSGTANLPDSLLSAGFGDWAHDVKALIAQETPVRAIDALSAERAIGAAMGLVVGQKPDELSFDLASRARQYFHDADEPFWISAQQALAANPEASTRLQDFVRKRANDFTSNPRRTAYMMRDGDPSDLVDIYMHHSRLRDVWCNSPYTSQVFLRNASAYSLLLRLDARAWLDALELFPTPEPVAEIVRQSCGYRPYDRLADLIRMASSPFDGDGNWRREHKVVFHLLQAVEEVLLQASGLASDGGNSVAFNDTLQGIAEAIAVRDDASWLGHAWLEELAWKDYAVGVWNNEGEDAAVSQPLLRLFEAIASVTPPLKAPLIWIRGDDDVWRRDRLVAAIAVMQAHAQTVDAGNLLTEVAKQGLASSTANFIESRQTLPCAVIGGTIAALTDPAAWLRNLWNMTFPLRDRARYISDTSGTVRVDMNLTCVIWGTAALHMSPHGTVTAQNIWIQTMEMTREAEITNVLDTDSDLAKGKRRLASLWSRTFPAPLQGNVPGSLEYFLASSAGPSLHYMNILLTLEASGVELADLAAAAGGESALRQLVSVILADIELERLRGRPNENAKVHLEALFSRI